MQLRMARGALDWTTRQVAAASDVPVHVIQAFLSGRSAPAAAIKRMQAAFEARGVLFLPQEGSCDVGVRMRIVELADAPPQASGTAAVEPET